MLSARTWCRQLPGRIALFHTRVRHCSQKIDFHSIRKNWELTFRQAHVQQLTTAEILPKDAIALFLSLLCAQQWEKIRQIFQHFESNCKRAQHARGTSDVILVPEGSSMTQELQRRDKDSFYASAVDVNIIGAVLIRFLQLGPVDGEITSGTSLLDCLCSFYSLLPTKLLHHPVLLSVILLPSWSTRRVRTYVDVNRSIQELCANRTDFIDEALLNNPSGMTLIHYLIFRKKFPDSQFSFELFREELRHACFGTFEYRRGDTDVNLLHELSADLVNPMSLVQVFHETQIVPRLRCAYLLSIVHFFSTSAGKNWKVALNYIEKLQRELPHIEDLSTVLSYCRACVIRLAAENGDTADVLRIYNASPSSEAFLDNHLLCSLGIVAARLQMESPPQILATDESDTQKVHYSIVTDAEKVKNSLSFASCISRLDTSHAQMPMQWVRMLLPRKFTPNTVNLCTELLQASQKKLTNDDIRAMSTIFKKCRSESSMKKLSQGLVYFADRRKNAESGQEEIDLFEKWEIFHDRRPSASLNITIPLGTATVLIHACLRVGTCDDAAFDLFWRFAFPPLRAHFNARTANSAGKKGTEVISRDIPNDTSFFAVCLASCMRLSMTKPIEIIIRYILDCVLCQEGESCVPVLSSSEKDYLESHYAPSGTALSHPMGYTVYTSRNLSNRLSSFAFMQSVLVTTRSYLSDAQSTRLRNFLEGLDDVEGMDGVKMNGEGISLSKVYDLCSGRFPKSLLS